MSIKEHVWVWKTIAKISVFVLIFTFVSLYFRELLLRFGLVIVDSETLIRGLLIAVGVIYILYSRFIRKVSSKVLADPKMISRVVLSAGGILKGQTNMKPDELEMDAIGFLSKKYTNLLELIGDGEAEFKTEAGNDMDFLFDFLELYDLSGNRVQTLVIKKEDPVQMDFVSKIPKGVKIEWKIDHINR